MHLPISKLKTALKVVVLYDADLKCYNKEKKSLSLVVPAYIHI